MSDRRLFIVVVDESASPNTRDQFTKYLQDKSSDFWHHLSNMWLIVEDEPGKTSVESLRKKCRQLMPDTYFFVMAAPLADFSAFVHEDGGPWLVKNLQAREVPD